MLLAEAEVAVQLVDAVGTFDPVAAGAEGELGGLRRLLERATGADESFGIDAVVHGLGCDGHGRFLSGCVVRKRVRLVWGDVHVGRLRPDAVAAGEPVDEDLSAGEVAQIGESGAEARRLEREAVMFHRGGLSRVRDSGAAPWLPR